MKGVLIGADLLKLENEIKFLEINTDVDLFTSDIPFMDLDPLFSYMSTNGYTKLVFIYKTVHVVDTVIAHFQSKCDSNNITLEKVIIPNNSVTIPSISEEPNAFYLRAAFDATAIIDDMYCKDKAEVVKLLNEYNNTQILPKTYIKFDDGTTFDNLTGLTDNGASPNIIVKKTLPDFYKNQYPEFRKVESLGSLNDLKLSLDDTVMAQDYQFNTANFEQGCISDVMRVWIVLLQDIETMIEIGGHATSNQVPVNENIITYTDELLDRKWRNMYFSNPRVITKGVPGLYEVIKIANGEETIVTLDSLAVSDTIKSVRLLGLNQDETLEYKQSWSQTGSLSDILEYTTASIVNKSTIDYEGWFREVSYQSGSITGSVIMTQAESMLIGESVSGSFKFKSVIDIVPNDLMVASTTTIATITNNQPFYYSGSVVTLNIEPDDVFVAGSDLNEINISTIGSIVHNFKGCSWCCFVGDTMVSTENGDIKIEDINVGDMVYTYNFETQTKELKRVYDKVSPIQSQMVEVTFSNGVINKNTTDHPYYTSEGALVSYNPEITKKWFNGEINKLTAETKCVTLNGEIVDVISLVEDNTDTQTYTLYVEDNHNFYANGLLVYDENKTN